eukprot:scpid50068/ scgid32829/ 
MQRRVVELAAMFLLFPLQFLGLVLGLSAATAHHACWLLLATGVEKTNDEARRSHMQKSNKWDACADVLLHSGRRQILSHHCREKRKYKKKDEEYWTANIKESRRKRKRISR